MKIKSNAFKNIFIISLILIIISCFSLPVFAEDVNTIKSGDDLTGMRKTAYDMAKTVYASSESELMKDVEAVVLYIPNEDDSSSEDDSSDESLTITQRQEAMDAIWGFAEVAYQSLEAIGAAIALLYFLLEILDKTTREMMSLEHFLIHFIKFIIAIFILNNGFALVEGLMGINKDICDAITNITINPDGDDGGKAEITDSATQLVNSVYDEVSSSGWDGISSSLSKIVQLSAPYFCTLVAKAYIVFMCWSRFFEIGIRTALAPIGMLDVITEGFKITNLKYIKKLFAVILQGTIIIVIMRLVGSAYTALSLSAEVATGGFSYLIILFVEIGLIKKAQQIASDVLGTH